MALTPFAEAVSATTKGLEITALSSSYNNEKAVISSPFAA